MELTEIILTVLSFLFGSSGIISTILYFKQNKRLKDLEVSKEEINVSESVVSNISKVNDEWQEALSQCDEDKKYYRDLCRDRYAEIKELNNEILRLQKRCNEQELDNQNLCFWKCTVRGCSNRKPPHEYD